MFGPEGPRLVPSRKGATPEVAHNPNSAAAKAAASAGGQIAKPVSIKHRQRQATT
jgi:hypothetical protein